MGAHVQGGERALQACCDGSDSRSLHVSNGPLAQSGRAPHSHCGGHRFKSGVVHVEQLGAMAQPGSALAWHARGPGSESL